MPLVYTLTAAGQEALTAEAGDERDGSALQIAVLENLVGNDPQTVREFLGDYLAAAQRLGSELRSAFAVGDAQKVGAIAHRLKSSSRSVGALPLGDLCAELENAGRAEDRVAIGQRMTQFGEFLAAVEAEVSAVLDNKKHHKGVET